MNIQWRHATDSCSCAFYFFTHLSHVCFFVSEKKTEKSLRKRITLTNGNVVITFILAKIAPQKKTLMVNWNIIKSDSAKKTCKHILVKKKDVLNIVTFYAICTQRQAFTRSGHIYKHQIIDWKILNLKFKLRPSRKLP